MILAEGQSRGGLAAKKRTMWRLRPQGNCGSEDIHGKANICGGLGVKTWSKEENLYEQPPYASRRLQNGQGQKGDALDTMAETRNSMRRRTIRERKASRH